MLGQPVEGPLVTATPIVERGEVRSGPLLTQSYELKNTGKSTLFLRGVEIGCGCGRYEISTETIEPGTTVKFTLTLNTLTLPEGPSSWAATIRYQSGRTNHELTVRLKATILREISIDPPVLALTTAGAVSQTITFTDRRKAPTRIAKAISANPHFTLELSEPVDAGGVRKQEIAWKVAESLPVGLHEETLMFTTDDPACPELRVPVKVTKRSGDGIEVTPAAPRIVCVPGEAEASVRVQLRAGGHAISVLKATSNNPGVTVRYAEGIAPMAVVRITLNGTEAGTAGKAEVVVTLAEPKGKTVVIPVSW